MGDDPHLGSDCPGVWLGRLKASVGPGRGPATGARVGGRLVGQEDAIGLSQTWLAWGLICGLLQGLGALGQFRITRGFGDRGEGQEDGFGQWMSAGSLP